jgi:hypothetical protein
MWVRVAKMHFTHAAKRWYPSVESHLHHADWQKFTQLATWENLLQLRQDFPRAPAWGQAGTQAPGSVGGPTTTATTSDEEAHGPRVGSRVRWPSVRLAGDEWM